MMIVAGELKNNLEGSMTRIKDFINSREVEDEQSRKHTRKCFRLAEGKYRRVEN